MVLRRIVVLSRHTRIRELARSLAQQALVADDPAEAVDIATTVNPDLILSDDLLQADEIRLILDTTDKISRCPVIIVGTNGEAPAWAQQLMKAGTIGYLADVDDYKQLQQIITSLQTGTNSSPSSNVEGFFADELAASVSMAGKSKAILQMLKMIKLVASSHCNPVLITGETGTGKELAAKAVHAIRHPNEQFVAVNCAALTANLLESELFGHTRGSFTGADRDKVGLLELADNGTIFLDEISEMPLDLQAKLLRVLQEKTFRKVGGITDLVCKATIIASSNRNLREEVQANRFRSDLYYRLNIFPITIAPLRSAERKADIRLLVEFFLKTSTVCPAKAGKITSITELTIEAIKKHNWPGNVRELRNVIERAILLETTEKIGLSSVLIESSQTGPAVASAIKDFSLDKAERELVACALQESGWQKTKAAAMLGITRATLYAKVKQHNIKRGTYVPKADDAGSLTCVEMPDSMAVA